MPSLKDVQGLPEDLPWKLGGRLTLHEDERRALERQEKLTAKWWAERDFERLPAHDDVLDSASYQVVAWR